MPTTTTTKSAVIPVRFTPAQRQQIDELSAAGWGNQADVIRTAIDRMHQQEIRTMNSGLTDNAWVKRVEEIRQMVADVPEAPVTAADIDFYIEQFGLQFDDEKAFAFQEFVRLYWQSVHAA